MHALCIRNICSWMVNLHSFWLELIFLRHYVMYLSNSFLCHLLRKLYPLRQQKQLRIGNHSSNEVNLKLLLSWHCG